MTELRSVAIETYNQAYELVVEQPKTNDSAGLELAATSLNLWRRVGNEQNLAVGLWLYSRALGNVGAQSASLAAAEQSVKIAEALEIDWLLASGLEALTRASVGSPEYSENFARAQVAIDSISDAEDRALINGQFADLR